MTNSRSATGVSRVLDDVKKALCARELPPVMKLSRGNLARVREDTRVSRHSKYICIGGDSGVELRLPNDHVDPRSSMAACRADGELWSGMSAFNRLFSIMVQLPEEDFPRSALVDFFGVWRELWDVPMGTRTQKMRAMLAFYEKHVGSLGRGGWVDTFDRDARFLLAHLRGRNPPVCPCCAGTGEGNASGCAVDGEAPLSDVGDDSQDGKSTESGNDSPGPDRGDEVCPSMEDTSVDCVGNSCVFSHECPCGDGCYSARECPDFDDRDALSGGDYGSTSRASDDDDDGEVVRAVKRRRLDAP